VGGFNYLIEVIEVSVASVQLIEINTTTGGAGVRVRVAVGHATVHVAVTVVVSVVVLVRVDVGHGRLRSVNSRSSRGRVTTGAGVLAGDETVVVVIK
jgi:hypothetical protein